jgi:hypothetical protein
VPFPIPEINDALRGRRGVSRTADPFWGLDARSLQRRIAATFPFGEKERDAMRISVFLVSLLVGTGAQAHVGHLGELAGHGHWIAAGALGAAIAVAGWNVLKGKKPENSAAKADGAPEENQQEA